MEIEQQHVHERRKSSVGVRILVTVAILGGLFAVGYAARARVQNAPAAAGGPAAGGPGGGRGAGPGGADRVVPVIAVPAERRDVPVYLEGIGNVTALKTVVVRTQVDGRLDRVAFREGQPVRRGELLALVDPRPFEIAVHLADAQLAKDTAQLKSAQLTLERYVAVRKQSLISQQQLDDQRAVVEQLEATLKSDQANIEHAKLQLEYAHITSPLDGITGVRLVDAGNIVHAGDPNGIVVLTQMDPIAVMFTLPQDDLPRIADEMSHGALDVEAQSRDGTAALGTGKLELIDNQINASTATIRLKAVMPNPRRALWPNQFVKTRLHLSTRANALVVPSAAVQRGPRGTFVYVVGKAQTAEMRTVQIDAIEGETAILASGLQDGDQVITEGQAQLRPGARVAVKGAGEDKRGGAGGPQGAAGRSGNARRRGGGAAL